MDWEDVVTLDVPEILERRNEELPISNCAQLPDTQLVD
jgi:hypothetical protein